MITSKSPGKLYIAGEYAVVEKAQPSIIIAVDQFIHVSLIVTKDKGRINTFNSLSVNFKHNKNKLILEYSDKRLDYVVNSIILVESMALALNKDLILYDLSIESDLENIDGKKYGLGSSAAVTVATIKVLCKLYNIDISSAELFKLSAIVHTEMGSKGSSGDLAASVYGGWISFKTFDKKWLKRKIKELSIEKLLKIEWPYLEITALTPPKDLKLLVGWTGKPASTEKLVENLNKNKNQHIEFYEKFLKNNGICVSKMIQAFEDGDTLEIQKQININRELLLELGDKFELKIQTKKLQMFNEIALKFDGAAKSSGAGGGDCGISVFKSNVDTNEIRLDWEKAGIEYLPLKVYTKRRKP